MADHKCPSTAIRRGSIIDLPKPVNPLLNVGSKNVSYFTPEQAIPSGTAIPDVEGDSKKPIPKLFQPLKLRSITLQNRIMVSPMCQYSAYDGHLTDWHLTHIGGIISRGPGLTIMEATAVSPEGRISPEDSGLWKDSQIEPIKRIVDFAHSQNQKICVQLAHAGRKASTVAPWIDRKAASPADARGWPNEVISVSDIPFDENTCVPKVMTLEDIASLKQKWVDAAKRAVQAGFDAVEIHAGHGYLLHSSLSAAVNRLPQPYSGSLENRMRLLLEVTELVRATIPEDMPLLVRIPGEDWVPSSMNGWEISQAIPLSLALADLGVDFIDVCSAGLMSEQKVISGPGYQAPFARDIKKALQEAGKNEKTVVGTVGMITSGVQAQKLLDDGWADAILAARPFIKSPALVWEWAAELGVTIRVANQIGWGFGQHPGGGVGGGHAKSARG